MAGQYAHPWDALLDTTATPVDTVANPDYDSAMGYAAKPGDSNATVFMKALQSSLQRNTPEGRELTAGIAKQKLANQFAIQLMQQKMELEKQYPTYLAHPLPQGGVMMVNPTNPKDNYTLGQVPGATEAYTSKIAAEKAKNDMAADPEVIGAERQQALLGPKKEQAQINYYNDRSELDKAKQEAAAAKAALGGQKPWTTEDDVRVHNQVAQEMAFNPKDNMFQMLINSGDPMATKRLTEYQQKVQERISKEKGERSQGRGGLVQPAASAQEPPDFSSLLQPLGQ
jgi:hypothetical protein